MMKYIAVLDEETLSYFQTDDYGRTLVLKDERGHSREINLMPIVTPLFANINGEIAYLTQGHIDCLLDYERAETIKKMVFKAYEEQKKAEEEEIKVRDEVIHNVSTDCIGVVEDMINGKSQFLWNDGWHWSLGE